MRLQLKTVRPRTGSDPISGVTGPDLIRQLRLPVWREYRQAETPEEGFCESVERDLIRISTAADAAHWV